MSAILDIANDIQACMNTLLITQLVNDWFSSYFEISPAYGSMVGAGLLPSIRTNTSKLNSILIAVSITKMVILLKFVAVKQHGVSGQAIISCTVISYPTLCFFPVRFPTESHVLIGWRAVRFFPFPFSISHFRNRTAPLVEQVLSKQVFSFIFSKNLAVIITLEWTTKAFSAKVNFIYILKSKTNMVCCFFHSTRDITLSINFSYTAERRPAFFMNVSFLLILRGKINTLFTGLARSG